jgi:single-strand DNA-binding protein
MQLFARVIFRASWRWKSMNKVVLIGRLSKDVELRTTTSGKSVATFTLAVNRDYKNAEGKYDADFITCVAFEQRAETISKFVSKGDRLGVSGKINTRNYEKSDGSKAYVTEIVVDGFEFLESKKDKPVAPKIDVEVDDFDEIDDEDLPFG